MRKLVVAVILALVHDALGFVPGRSTSLGGPPGGEGRRGRSSSSGPRSADDTALLTEIAYKLDAFSSGSSYSRGIIGGRSCTALSMDPASVGIGTSLLVGGAGLLVGSFGTFGEGSRSGDWRRVEPHQLAQEEDEEEERPKMSVQDGAAAASAALEAEKKAEFLRAAKAPPVASAGDANAGADAGAPGVDVYADAGMSTGADADAATAPAGGEGEDKPSEEVTSPDGAVGRAIDATTSYLNFMSSSAAASAAASPAAQPKAATPQAVSTPATKMPGPSSPVASAASTGSYLDALSEGSNASARAEGCPTTIASYLDALSVGAAATSGGGPGVPSYLASMGGGGAFGVDADLSVGPAVPDAEQVASPTATGSTASYVDGISEFRDADEVASEECGAAIKSYLDALSTGGAADSSPREVGAGIASYLDSISASPSLPRATGGTSTGAAVASYLDALAAGGAVVAPSSEAVTSYLDSLSSGAFTASIGSKSDASEVVKMMAKIAELEATIKRKRTELFEVRDAVEKYSEVGYMRKVAEMDQIRKTRGASFKSNEFTARAGAVENFLPVLDELEALDAKYDGNAFAESYSGLRRDLNNAFTALGMTEYAAEVGMDADPVRFDAVQEEYSDTHPKGTVIAPVGVGMEIEGNVMRRAKCVVSLGSEAEAVKDAEEKREGGETAADAGESA